MSLNKVDLLGRFVKDPEIKSTQTGKSVVAFTLAVERNFAKKGEQKQTDFINCVAWNHTADFINKYFKKGSMVAVSGSLQTRTWDDPNGKKNYITEVIVTEVYSAGGKQEQGSSSDTRLEGFTPMPTDDDLPF